MALHTRVIVKVRKDGDLFWNRIQDRGAKFRDEADIARVANEMKTEMGRGYANPVFKVETREAG